MRCPTEHVLTVCPGEINGQFDGWLHQVSSFERQTSSDRGLGAGTLLWLLSFARQFGAQ